MEVHYPLWRRGNEPTLGRVDRFSDETSTGVSESLKISRKEEEVLRLHHLILCVYKKLTWVLFMCTLVVNLLP